MSIRRLIIPLYCGVEICMYIYTEKLYECMIYIKYYIVMWKGGSDQVVNIYFIISHPHLLHT